MTCLSQTAPLAPRRSVSLPHGWLAVLRHGFRTVLRKRSLAPLDDRALGDLGLSRDTVDPPRPRDRAGLWLDRIPG